MYNLTKTILKEGVNNCIFLGYFSPLRKILCIRYTSSDDTMVFLPAKISEERYLVKDNYKVTLLPLVDGFAKQDFYISDLETLVRQHIFNFCVRKEIN